MWLIWTVAVLAAVWLYWRQAYSKLSRHGIRHLRPLPFLGNTGKSLVQIEHGIDSYEKVFNAFKEDRFVGYYEFTRPVIVVKDLELIRRITIKDFDYFLDHRGLIDENIEPMFARNLFVLKGQQWKDMRSTLSPAFTSSKIRNMIPFMEEAVSQMIRSVKMEMDSSKVGYITMDCKSLLSRFANDVIASAAFGLQVNSHTDRSNQFYEMGRKMTQFSGLQMLKFLAFISVPKLAKFLKIKLSTEEVRSFFRNLVMDTMEDRIKRNICRKDMIHLLMEAKKGQLNHSEKVSGNDDAGFATVEESEIGKKRSTTVWSDEDLIAQAVIFLLAGFETVSTVMTFALFELAANPDVQEKLYEEIKEHHNNSNGSLEYNSFQRMPYLDMVISETLRKWPPALFSERICTKNYNLGRPNVDSTKDYIIKEGEGIFIPTWVIQRCPEYFPDPDKFDPQRFSEENKHKIHPCTYLPFGMGPRNCIGSRFALCEMKVMLYHLLYHVRVTPCEKTCLPIQLAKGKFNLLIKGGHWLRMEARC